MDKFRASIKLIGPRIGVSLAMTLVCLGLAEIATRYFSPQVTATLAQGMVMPDDELGYRIPPHISGWNHQPEYSVLLESNSQG